MIQLTLNFETAAEAMDALAKLGDTTCTCAGTPTPDAPAAPAPVAPAAPAPVAPVAPVAPAPVAPAAPAPAAPAPVAPAAPAPVAEVTLEDLHNRAVAIATAKADQGASVFAVLAQFGVKGLSGLPVDQYPAFLQALQAMEV